MSEHHDRPDEHADREELVGGTPDEGSADDRPAGGDEKTEDRVEADNAVEEDQIRALDPDAPTG